MTLCSILPTRLASLIHFLTGIVTRTLYEQFPAQSPYVQVSGYLGRFEGKRLYGDTYYGLPLTEGMGEEERFIPINISRALIDRKGLAAGQYVEVRGLLSVKPRKNRVAVFEFYIQVDDADASIAPLAQEVTDTDVQPVTIEALKNLGAKRNSFPHKERILVSAIHPNDDSVVYEDFASQVRELGGLIEFKRHPADMTSSRSISKAISDAEGDILAILRGGGDTLDFSRFDTISVIKALAQTNAYRVLGIGHSKTATVLDLICEHSGTTPSAAGTHIKEAVQRYLKDGIRVSNLEAERDRLRSEKMQLQQLSHAAQARFRQQQQRFYLFAVFIAGMCVIGGFLIAWKILR